MNEVLNMDMVGLYNRLNRFINEVQKCQSANVSMTSVPDTTRIKSYLSTLRFLVEHIDADPQLDLPETNPQTYTLREAPVLLDLENENCVHLALLLSTARDEIVMSQSARMSTGFVIFDKTRFLASITKAENYLANYVAKATPIDLPESSPRAPIQGKGLTGTGTS